VVDEDGNGWCEDVESKSGENNNGDNEAFDSLWSFGPSKFACNLDSSDSIQHYLLHRDGA
jgi:hypothetical protein